MENFVFPDEIKTNFMGMSNCCTFFTCCKIMRNHSKLYFFLLFICKSFNFNLNFKNGRQLKRPKNANTTHFSPTAFRYDPIHKDPSTDMSVKRRSSQGVGLGI